MTLPESGRQAPIHELIVSSSIILKYPQGEVAADGSGEANITPPKRLF